MGTLPADADRDPRPRRPLGRRPRRARGLPDHDAGMHVIDRTDKFTLVGADARRGKLTLFAAEGPREPGALARVGLRVFDLDEALAGPPARTSPSSAGGRTRRARGRRGPPARASSRRTRASSTTSTTSPSASQIRPRPSRSSPSSASPSRTAGSRPATPGRARAGRARGDRAPAAQPPRPARGVGRRPHRGGASERGLEIADVVDAPNTYAVFVWGPDRIKLEYVEHKPTFSLT